MSSSRMEIEYHVKRRDAYLRLADAENQILEALAPPDTQTTVAVKEEAFSILTFEPQQGTKIGSYEVAYKADNLEDKWAHAYSILRQGNSTINARYRGPGYVYSYWIYGEGKIYRQKLKAQA